ncbi:MAG: hypothetical protein AAGC56_09165 [Pseudomonadota bacterium]
MNNRLRYGGVRLVVLLLLAAGALWYCWINRDEAPLAGRAQAADFGRAADPYGDAAADRLGICGGRADAPSGDRPCA